MVTNDQGKLDIGGELEDLATRLAGIQGWLDEFLGSGSASVLSSADAGTVEIFIRELARDREELTRLAGEVNSRGRLKRAA